MNVSQKINFVFLKLTAICLLGILFSYNGQAQTWKDKIKPIHSTCENVQNVFKGNPCSKGSISYITPGEHITFVFADGAICSEKSSSKYDLPKGTVTSIIVIYRFPKELMISDLEIDKTKFNKSADGDLINSFVYESDELGMRFTASENQVLNITYYPSKDYDHLRCSNLNRNKTEI